MASPSLMNRLIFPFLLGVLLKNSNNNNIADGSGIVDWTTGKQLSTVESRNAPVVITESGEIVLQASLIDGIMPNPITLHFNTSIDSGHRHMQITVCRLGECQIDAKLIFCFIGQMDQENDPVNSQFELENYEKDNEIASKCKKAQKTKWAKEFGKDKILHGVQFVMDSTEQKQTMNLYTSTHKKKHTHVELFGEKESCANISLGEFGILDGFVGPVPTNKTALFRNRSFWGYLLCMEEPITALSYDMLAGLPQQGGKLGVIGHKDNDKCPFAIRLGGENGLAKCVGKMCAKSP
ncbi:hypothetical protein niasHS_017368 [Heterodera schachtii]|uniref:Uncharacterized protein n=1 Tax=Heterodera schachtii TaxID=97005 RepID=A0ABD2HR81_HETSC